MDKKTLEALQKTIEQWEKIIEGKEEDRAAENCPLCALFPTFFCSGCPIRERTRWSNCRDTPYERWEFHHMEIHNQHNPPWKIECDECRRLAEEELNFLKELLPKK